MVLTINRLFWLWARYFVKLLKPTRHNVRFFLEAYLVGGLCSYCSGDVAQSQHYFAFFFNDFVVLLGLDLKVLIILVTKKRMYIVYGRGYFQALLFKNREKDTRMMQVWKLLETLTERTRSLNFRLLSQDVSDGTSLCEQSFHGVDFRFLWRFDMSVAYSDMLHHFEEATYWRNPFLV